MINLDKTNYPSIAKEMNFNDWLKNAKFMSIPFLNDAIDHYIKTKDINVSFSNEQKEESIGYLSYQEVRNYIRRCYKTNPGARAIISTIYEREDISCNLSDLVNALLEVNEGISDGDISDTLIYLMGLMKTKIYAFSKKDLFDSIIIYPSKYYAHCLSIEEFCEVAFIKELFHICFDYLAKKVTDYKHNDGFERKDYLAKLVKESLTTYFVFRYCKTYGINTEFLNVFAPCIPTYVPEAGYKYISDDLMFAKVLKKSLENSDEAVRMMFGDSNEVLYETFNHDFYLNYTLREDKKSNYSTIIPYDFMIDFEDYLLRKTSGDTYKSYLSWVRSAFETYLRMDIRILSVLDYNSRIQTVKNVLDLIKDNDSLANNQKSALRALLDFISEENNSWNGIDITVK